MQAQDALAQLRGSISQERNAGYTTERNAGLDKRLARSGRKR